MNISGDPPCRAYSHNDVSATCHQSSDVSATCHQGSATPTPSHGELRVTENENSHASPRPGCSSSRLAKPPLVDSLSSNRSSLQRQVSIEQARQAGARSAR